MCVSVDWLSSILFRWPCLTAICVALVALRSGRWTRNAPSECPTLPTLGCDPCEYAAATGDDTCKLLYVDTLPLLLPLNKDLVVLCGTPIPTEVPRATLTFDDEELECICRPAGVTLELLSAAGGAR